jgi:hypothetical protein
MLFSRIEAIDTDELALIHHAPDRGRGAGHNQPCAGLAPFGQPRDGDRRISHPELGQ